MSVEEFRDIHFATVGPVATITIDRPERMNAIGPTTADELRRAWSAFVANDALSVAILTGTGADSFCAGADLKAVAAMFAPDAMPDEQPLIDFSADERHAHRAGLRDGIIGPSRRTDIYKPIIAAVNGAAYAGGLEWACFADIRIAEEHATFGVTCRRWNIGLGDGGTQRLPRIVGMGRAMELILTGRVIGVDEALSIGLVNEVVPSGQSLSRAHALAATLAALPQPAMRTDKEAAERGFGQPLAEGLRIEAECFDRLLDDSSADAMAAGVRRFLDGQR